MSMSPAEASAACQEVGTCQLLFALARRLWAGHLTKVKGNSVVITMNPEIGNLHANALSVESPAIRSRASSEAGICRSRNLVENGPELRKGHAIRKEENRIKIDSVKRRLEDSHNRCDVWQLDQFRLIGR